MSDSQTFDTEELIAHAPDAIIFADSAGVIRLWNRAAETMFGYGAAEAIGQTLDLIVPEPYRVAHWAGFSRAVTQGRFAKDDVLLTSRALTKDGRIIAVELSAAIVRSPSGQVRGIMAIGRDITERRAREQVQHERIASLERQVAAPAEGIASAAEGGATVGPDPAAGGSGDRVMDRRTFVSGLTLGLLAAPLAAEAQRPAKVARIGYLATGSLESPETQAILVAFRQGLGERGYVEGQNIVIEYRAADGNFERGPGLALELVRLKVNLIVVGNTPMARAAQQATKTIPIVASVMGDPVGDGLVASLAHPGGNITGLTFLGPELVPKRLDLLKEALPRVSRAAVLWHPGAFSERTTQEMLRGAEGAARALGVQLQLVGVRGADEFARAFSTMVKERAEALVVFPSSMLFNERRRIVELATNRPMPSIFAAREFVELGGLLSYGASIADLSRRGATYVDKILKGAKPAELPVERPTKFELVINLKTAKALGLTIPQSLLLRADQVIE